MTDEWRSLTHRFAIGEHKGTITAAVDADGRPVLLQIHMAKGGGPQLPLQHAAQHMHANRVVGPVVLGPDRDAVRVLELPERALRMVLGPVAAHQFRVAPAGRGPGLGTAGAARSAVDAVGGTAAARASVRAAGRRHRGVPTAPAGGLGGRDFLAGAVAGLGGGGQQGPAGARAAEAEVLDRPGRTERGAGHPPRRPRRSSCIRCSGTGKRSCSDPNALRARVKCRPPRVSRASTQPTSCAPEPECSRSRTRIAPPPSALASAISESRSSAPSGRASWAVLPGTAARDPTTTTGQFPGFSFLSDIVPITLAGL